MQHTSKKIKLMFKSHPQPATASIPLEGLCLDLGFDRKRDVAEHSRAHTCSCLCPAPSHQHSHRIVESLRLEKTSMIIKSGHQPNITKPAKPCPEVPYQHIFLTPPVMVTPPPPWAILTARAPLDSQQHHCCLQPHPELVQTITASRRRIDIQISHLSWKVYLLRQ